LRLASLFKSTFFYTVIGFLPVASQAILAPLFSNYLSQHEYGIINLLNVLGVYMMVFMGLGFESAFSVYYFYYFKHRRWLYRLISTVFISVIVFAVVLLLLVFMFEKPIHRYFVGSTDMDFSPYLLPVFCISLTTTFFTLIQYLFRNEENMKLYAIFSVSFFLLISAGQYLGLELISKDAWGITIGRMIASILMGIIIVGYIFRVAGIFFSFRFFKKCFAYAYPMALYGLLWVAFENIDKLSMNKNFGKDILGIYGIAVLFHALLELIRTAFINAINPAVYRNIALNDPDAKKTTETSIRFFSVVLCNAIAILLAFSWPLLYLFINSKFHGAILFVPMLFLSMVPRLYFSFIAMPLFYFGKTKALAIINLISLIGSWLYLYFAGQSFGPMGICFVVVLAKLIQCLGVWMYSLFFSKMKVKYGFAQIGKDNIIVAVTTVCLILTIILISRQSSYAYLFDLLPLLTVAVTLGMYGKRVWRKALQVVKTRRFKAV
jgi:O-antigen/teichoic acid export membrane protein